MTKHLKDRPYLYSGICLENGFLVSSTKRKRYVALCQIIDKITEGSLLGEKVFAERHPNQTYEPFKDLENELPNLKKQFTKRMKKALSLNEYVSIQEKLKPLWDKQRFAPEEKNEIQLKKAVLLAAAKFFALCTFVSILRHSVPILYDSKEMKLAQKRINENPRFCNSTIKYRRI